MLLVSVTLEERTGRAEAQLMELEERRKIRNAFFPTHLNIIECAARSYVNASVAVFVQDVHESANDMDIDMDVEMSSEEDIPPPVSPTELGEDSIRMITTIFQTFDMNADGHWDMTEANQWMRVCMEDSAFDISGWERTCSNTHTDPNLGLDIKALQGWYTTSNSLQQHYRQVTVNGEVDPDIGIPPEAEIHKLETMLDIIFKGYDVMDHGVWNEEACLTWIDTIGWLDSYNDVCEVVGADPDVGLTKDDVALLYNINEYRLTKHYEEMAKQRPEDSTFNAVDDENEADYCFGGYHRVSEGDVYNDRWVVTRKLGWGNFSTVWLAKDKLGQRSVALKIGKGAESLHEMSELEVQVLQKTNQFYDECECEILKGCAKRLVKLEEYFDITGPHGLHPTMAIEVVGPDILKLITAHDFAGVAPCITKTLVKHMLQGLAFLHSIGLAHADIKPENVLIQTMDMNGDCDPAYVEKLLSGTLEKPEDMSLAEFMDRTYSCKVSDFGSSKWVENDKSVHKMQTLEYRAPEVVLGYSADVAIDVWSVACTCYELLTGCFLFNPKAIESSCPQDGVHVALFMETLGMFPESLSKGSGWHCTEYFDEETGMFKYGEVEVVDLKESIVSKHKATPEQAEGLVSFLLPMLELNPNHRTPAIKAIDHPWLAVTEADAIPFSAEGRKRLGMKLQGDDDTDSESSCSSDTVPSPSLVLAGHHDVHLGQQEETLLQSLPPPSVSHHGRPYKDTVILDLRQRADYADLRREELIERRRLRTQFFPAHLEAIKESARARA